MTQYISQPRRVEVAYPVAGSTFYPAVLLHCDGAAGSQSFTDESGKTWTAVNQAQVNVDAKFGTGAAIFDGVGDYIYTNNHADFSVGTGDYTITLQLKTTQATRGTPFYQGDAAGLYNSISYLAHINAAQANKFAWCPDYIRWISGGHHWLYSLTSVNDGNYHHIACVRHGDVFTLYVDGIGEATVTLSGFSTPASASPFCVGCMPAPNYYNALNGKIDEFAFYQSAIYTSNFTAPIVPYSASRTQMISEPRRLEVAYGGLNCTMDAEISSLWSGNIVTVGPSGRDYVNPYAAIVAAPSGSLILIDAGSYHTPTADLSVYKTLLIRGLGSLASDTVLAAPIGSSGCLFDFYSSSNIVFENLEMYADENWSVPIRVSGSANLTVNRCYLYDSNGTGYPFAGLWDTGYTGTTIFRNTYLRKGNKDITGQLGYNLSLSKIHLQKVQLSGALALQYTSGSLAENDSVTSPTADYGFAYGVNLINPFTAYISNPRELEIAYAT